MKSNLITPERTLFAFKPPSHSGGCAAGSKTIEMLKHAFESRAKQIPQLERWSLATK